MAKKGEKILTQKQVCKLGLDKISVITADMLEGYTSIGDYAFYRCINLTSVTIPGGVTAIEIGAFYGCCDLASIKIPNSVTSIGHSAFYDCTSLASIKIPNSVTSIAEYTFYYCTGLTSITIPNSVTSIGRYAFSGCISLTSIEIPDSVTSIGWSAFDSCIGLTSVTIPCGVTSIGDSAFWGCNSLPYVTIGNKTYKPQTVTNGKCKAYKAFNSSMKCRNFQYNEGETYEFEGEPELCTCGFHASLCLLDVFNYYWGKIDKDVVVHEVELEGVSAERRKYESKVVAKKITIGKRIL